MEVRLTIMGIAVVLLQWHPEQPREWAPVATWGCCLDALEQLDSCVLLELKALCEGTYKLLEFTAFAKHLTMRVRKELRALLKVALKVHPELQALLTNLLQYQPKPLVDEHRVSPEELEMHKELAPALEEWALDKLLDDMMTAEAALQ